MSNLIVGIPWATPGAIGATTPAAGTFTTLTANTSLVINGGTAITGQSGTGGTVAMTASPIFTGTPVLNTAEAVSIETALIAPPADGVTAFQVTKADGTTVVLNVDTTNSRIGINTAAPAFPLSLGSATGDKLALFDSGATQYGFGIQGGLLQAFCPSGNRIGLGYGASGAFNEILTTTNSSGLRRVGINQTNPGFTLDAQGGGVVEINIYGTGSGGQSNLRLKALNSNAGNNEFQLGLGITADNQLLIRDVANSNHPVYQYITSNAGTSEKHLFYITGSEVMRIDNSGHVGIGTPGPGSPLDIVGNTGTSAGLGLGNESGFGNGVVPTAVTTILKVTGTGPTTPQTIVNFLKVNLAGTAYWIPVMV